MNYRHAFHAGSFADVFKHIVMTRILVHLSEKPAAYRVLDTHAGAGLYDLSSAEARRTGEWRDGIGRLAGFSPPPPVSLLLAPYRDAIAAINRAGPLKLYPGSPVLALALMRPQDRLTACELEPRAAAALAKHLHDDARANAVAIDGWTALNAYIPPKERRGLVVVDPPFEDEGEFARLAKGIEDTHRKWPTGIYLIWYPAKDSAPSVFAKRLKRSGIARMLRAELQVAPRREQARLGGAGVIVVNPPWRLAEELETLLPELANVLSQGQADSFVEQLTYQM
jgi:23S rRNA (adenine2030-N6)-methyltransferase